MKRQSRVSYFYAVSFDPPLPVPGHSMGCSLSPAFNARRTAHRYAMSLPGGTTYEIIRHRSTQEVIERGRVRVKS